MINEKIWIPIYRGFSFSPEKVCVSHKICIQSKFNYFYLHVQSNAVNETVWSIYQLEQQQKLN